MVLSKSFAKSTNYYDFKYYVCPVFEYAFISFFIYDNGSNYYFGLVDLICCDTI